MVKTDDPSGKPALAEIGKSYQADFLAEICERLDEIELALVNLEMEPGNRSHLQDVYRGYHTIRGLAAILGEESAVGISSASEDLIESLRKYASAITANAVNLLLRSTMLIRRICRESGVSLDPKFAAEVEQHIHALQQLGADLHLEVRQPIERETRIGEILVQEGAIGQQDVEEILRKQDSLSSRMKFGEIVLRDKKVDASDIIRAIRMQKIRSTSLNDQYVRIPLERLDQILGIIDSVNGIYDELRDEAILRFGSNDFFTLESGKAFHMLDDIRRILREMRMVTLQQSFQKITRTVCAIIEENSLDVMFSTIGENIEMDKDIAERLVVPVAELVRGILDAGRAFGSEEERRLRNIELVAYEENEEVRLDLNADANIPGASIRREPGFSELVRRITALKGRLTVDELTGEGLRVRIAFQR